MLSSHLAPSPAWRAMVFGSLAKSGARSISSAQLKGNMFQAGVFLNPHMEKRHKGGEDAATICSTMVAVADGVGGWAESGVDPAIYSKRLCSLFEELWETGDHRYLASPKNLLVDAVKRNTETGSCTACIVQIDQEAPVLTTCNLGDSGYMILRKGSAPRMEVLY